MAEVKKKFSQLDPGSVPFDGMETIAAVQGGITKRGTISGIHGAGWWDKLKAGFVDFIAPEALHANDADTLGGETSAELHNAGALTGTAPLSAIPAELTGKNADLLDGLQGSAYAKVNTATSPTATDLPVGSYVIARADDSYNINSNVPVRTTGGSEYFISANASGQQSGTWRAGGFALDAETGYRFFLVRRVA